MGWGVAGGDLVESGFQGGVWTLLSEAGPGRVWGASPTQLCLSCQAGDLPNMKPPSSLIPEPNVDP